MSSEAGPPPARGAEETRRYRDALVGPLFSTDAVAEATADRAQLQAMLDVEAALAAAGSDVGLVPASAAAAIAEVCDADRFDIAAIGAAGEGGGNPVIPLVAAINAQLDPVDAAYVHLGATSQDILDTAMMLLCRSAGALVLADLDALIAAAAVLAATHRDTVIAGRTLLQHAVPITFGFKAAVWLDAALDARSMLGDVLDHRLAAQFGGAAGTLAPLGDKGARVLAALALRLGLAEPTIAWHANRSRIVELASALALVCGALGKIGKDVALLMQVEVAEAFEPAGEGRGGSSTLPHKRNPVGATLVDAAARRSAALVSIAFSSLVVEHERSVGAWHAEFQLLTELLRLAGSSAARMSEILGGLEVDPARMRANFDLLQGLPLAERVTFVLSDRLGRAEARRLTEAAARRAAEGHVHFAETLAQSPEIAAVLSEGEVTELLDPAGYLGTSGEFIDRVLRRAGEQGR